LKYLLLLKIEHGLVVSIALLEEAYEEQDPRQPSERYFLCLLDGTPQVLLPLDDMAPSSLILTQSGLDVYTIHSQPSLYSKPTVDVHLTQVNDGQILLDRDSSAMETFLTETRTLFETSLEPKRLHAMSRHLQDEFIAKLEASHICMLPSFHHTLPKGSETGTILALDVGGSTFRLALIELTGRKASQGNDGMEIKTMKSFPIDNIVRALRGLLFFDWMAARIRDILAMDTNPIASASNPNKPLPMALSWSFPITQTSTCSGSLLEMGKGFLATAGVEGQDIGLLVASACQSLGLHVSLEAIVNDSSATLLSQAYRDPSTRISLINGTGINSAIYLPLSTLARDKIGHRGDGWWKEAKHVIVNTEISMFGRDVWDRTRWDDELNAMLPLPNFQPLEYQAGGRFLGELVRLILVEAVEKGVLFGGQMPQDLGCKYGLSTQLVGSIERCVPRQIGQVDKKTLTDSNSAIKHPTSFSQQQHSPNLTLFPFQGPKPTSPETYNSSALSPPSSLLVLRHM